MDPCSSPCMSYNPNSVNGEKGGLICGTRTMKREANSLDYFSHEPLSKLLVSPSITTIVVPHVIPYITPLRSLDYFSHMPQECGSFLFPFPILAFPAHQ